MKVWASQKGKNEMRLIVSAPHTVFAKIPVRVPDVCCADLLAIVDGGDDASVETLPLAVLVHLVCLTDAPCG